MARLYIWQGIDSTGSVRKGEVIAASAAAAQQQILQQGCFPLTLNAGQTIRHACWHPAQRIAFIRQLATLLQAGLPLLQSLHLLADQHDSAPWRYLLRQLHQKVEGGIRFSHAIAAFPAIFPPLYQQMIATGEMTGFLDLCCLRLAEQQEKELVLRTKVRKALRYPLFVMGATMLVTLLMLQFVLPEFSKIYQDFQAPLPALTQSLITVSELLGRFAFPLLLTVMIAVLAYRRWLRPHPGWRTWQQNYLLRLPFFKQLLCYAALGRLCGILAMSQTAGLPLLDGLSTATESEPLLPFVEALTDIHQQLASGVSLHNAIGRHKLFPPLVRQLLQIGEESGTLEMMLTRLAETYEQNANELSEQISQTIEPLLMIFIAVIVGTLVVAMYLPIFQLGNVIK